MSEVIDAERYGPWAVIAGGSEGTGAEYARALTAAGISVLLVARRSDPLEHLAEDLRKVGAAQVRTLSLDLNLADAADRMAEASRDLDVGLFIANAGADTGMAPFLDTDLSRVQAMIARNVLTTVAACHHFARGMRARGRGGIILMGSGAGLGGQPGVAAYASAKAFVLTFAESLWAELRGHGVDVLGVAAPVMETPSLRRLIGDVSIPGIVPPADVVSDALARLPDRGPSRLYLFTGDEADSERQETARRERVLAVERFSAVFAGEGAA